MRKATAQSTALEPDRTVTVLSVSADENQHSDLRMLFQHSNWVLLEARSCGGAREMVERHGIPVVVCDSLLPDGTWKDICAAPAFTTPSVIVAAHHADDELWSEVLDAGGYNVVDKPFHRAELFRIISTAWRQWKQRTAMTAQPVTMRAAG